MIEPLSPSLTFEQCVQALAGAQQQLQTKTPTPNPQPPQPDACNTLADVLKVDMQPTTPQQRLLLVPAPTPNITTAFAS